MNKLIYLLLISIYFLDYFSAKLGLLPRSFTWLPEFLSMAAIVIVMMRLGESNNAFDRKYIVFIVIFVLYILIGMVVNTVPAGGIIIGLRNYLKFIPFFLIPAVYAFSESQLRGQIKFLLAVFLLQVPLAIFQRVVLTKHISGDGTFGTVNVSSLLTIIMVSAITFSVAFYLKKRISITQAVMLILIFFIPTTLNETKSTLVLLPLALILPVFLYRGRGMSLGKMIPILLLGVVTMAIFFSVYNYLNQRWWGGELGDFLTEGTFESYLYKGTDANKQFERMGKIDSYVMAFQVLSEKPMSLMMGLGAGNVVSSFIGGVSGEYAQTYGRLGVTVTALSYIMWELGIIGVILHLWLFFMVFKDSRELSRHDDLGSVFALGWASVTLIIIVTLGYKNFLYANVMGYMFWYFSGYVVAQNIRVKRRLRAAAQNPP